MPAARRWALHLAPTTHLPAPRECPALAALPLQVGMSPRAVSRPVMSAPTSFLPGHVYLGPPTLNHSSPPNPNGDMSEHSDLPFLEELFWPPTPFSDLPQACLTLLENVGFSFLSPADLLHLKSFPRVPEKRLA